MLVFHWVLCPLVAVQIPSAAECPSTDFAQERLLPGVGPLVLLQEDLAQEALLAVLALKFLLLEVDVLMLLEVFLRVEVCPADLADEIPGSGVPNQVSLEVHWVREGPATGRAGADSVLQVDNVKMLLHHRAGGEFLLALGAGHCNSVLALAVVASMDMTLKLFLCGEALWTKRAGGFPLRRVCVLVLHMFLQQVWPQELLTAEAALVLEQVLALVNPSHVAGQDVLVPGGKSALLTLVLNALVGRVHMLVQ